MKTIRLRKISFSAYLKISMINGLVVGVIFGILAFIMGILGGQVTAHIGDQVIYGFKAGLICLILAPLGMALSLMLWAVIAVLPLNLGLKLTRGVKVDLDYECEEETEFKENQEKKIENQIEKQPIEKQDQ